MADVVDYPLPVPLVILAPSKSRSILVRGANAHNTNWLMFSDEIQTHNDTLRMDVE